MSGEELKAAAWLYEREDGSKDLVLDCNGEYARRLIEIGATETPLYAHPLSEQRQEGWRTMDSAPKDGTRILGYADGGHAVVYWSRGGDAGWELSELGAFAEDGRWEPTHWMPLPSPPSTETKESGE